LLYGKPDATIDQMQRALDELGLGDWIADLPSGLDTPVGQRSESLSAGERQLVALARAYLVDPDVLVLDEATSAVDPAADVRLQQAIDGLARGRTTITIAHRLSTAERADQIMVLDDGDLVEHGTHDELVDLEDGIYAGLHRSWIAHRETCLRSRSAGWVGPLTADTGPRAWTRVDQGSATGPCLTRTPGPACVAPAGAPRAWHRTGPKIRTVPDPQHPPVPPVSRRSQPRFRSRER